MVPFIIPTVYVFGPPGSGSFSQRYGSGFSHHQARKKPLIFIQFCDFLYDFLSVKNDVFVNVPSKSNKQKNLEIFVLHLEGHTKRAGSGARFRDTDPRKRLHTKL